MAVSGGAIPSPLMISIAHRVAGNFRPSVYGERQGWRGNARLCVCVWCSVSVFICFLRTLL